MDELVGLMAHIKSVVPPYVRISRVMRDIPPKFIIAGCKDLALRSVVKQRMTEEGLHCHCIRCREFGHRLRDGWSIGKPVLKRIDYRASDGNEIFLSFEDEQETLFGLLRLRKNDSLLGDSKTTMVRELHVFGSEVPLGVQHDSATQHKGLGGRLLKEAERISQHEFRASKIAIISGVGARDYFHSEFDYTRDGPYMVKKFKE